ncbi:MAG: RsmB/NOP family class I SAM-dependent RNA methyltransferase [Candidatus Altiarchaeota archaeon]
MNFPAELEESLKTQLGSQYTEFIECCERPPRKSYRVNTIKADVDEITGRFDSQPIPWCPIGFHTKDDLGSTIEHYQGLIYIQESASMLPAEVLSPREGDVVLDLAAAPGSKTTQLAALMSNRGCVIGNDVDFHRLKTLRFNLNRMGVVNTVVTNMDGVRFNPDIKFDKILLDAPCSNVGQLRDNPDAIGTWSPAKVSRCSHLQKRLIASASTLLNDDGVLLYSTCTFSPEENEEVVDYAVREHGLKVEEIEGKFKAHEGIRQWSGMEYDREVKKTARIYPHDNDTGGFYIAKLRK